MRPYWTFVLFLWSSFLCVFCLLGVVGLITSDDRKEYGLLFPLLLVAHIFLFLAWRFMDMNGSNLIGFLP